MAYTAISEWMDDKEFAQFERELYASGDPKMVSHGTGALLALFGMPPRPPARGAG